MRNEREMQMRMQYVRVPEGCENQKKTRRHGQLSAISYLYSCECTRAVMDARSEDAPLRARGAWRRQRGARDSRRRQHRSEELSGREPVARGPEPLASRARVLRQCRVCRVHVLALLLRARPHADVRRLHGPRSR